MLRTDMRVTCKHCGGPHPAFECRKRSTAARKDVRRGKGGGRSGAKGQIVEASVAVAQMGETPVQPEVAGSSPASAAGTQALPVDTSPVLDAKAVKVNMVATIATEPAQEAQILRPGPNAGSSNGRTAELDSANAGSTPAPASKFNKKAWMREYMKIYMARYREDVKRGKRTPQKKVKAS